MSAVFSKADLMFNHNYIHIHAPKRSPTCWDEKWGTRSTRQNIFTYRFFKNAVDWSVLQMSCESMKTARSSSSNPPTGNQSTFWMPKTEFAKFSILSEENICIHNCLSENSALHNMLNIRRTKICLKSHVPKKNQKSKIIIQVCVMFFWKAALCGAVTVHHCALSNHQE